MKSFHTAYSTPFDTKKQIQILVFFNRFFETSVREKPQMKQHGLLMERNLATDETRIEHRLGNYADGARF